VEAAFCGGHRISYWQEQKFIALENVFSALDGKGQICKSHKSAIANELEKTRAANVETPYFKVKCFGNGNMHIEFKRLDLLEKFNRIAGGKNLRPANP